MAAEGLDQLNGIKLDQRKLLGKRGTILPPDLLLLLTNSRIRERPPDRLLRPPVATSAPSCVRPPRANAFAGSASPLHSLSDANTAFGDAARNEVTITSGLRAAPRYCDLQTGCPNARPSRNPGTEYRWRMRFFLCARSLRRSNGYLLLNLL
jgi:hypothetical protein